MRKSKRPTKKRASAKLAELAVAAPQVVGIRTARILSAGIHPSAADRLELSNMGREKVHAFWESMFAMNAQIARMNLEYASRAISQSWRLWTNPSWIAGYRPTSPTIRCQPLCAGVISDAASRQHQRAVSRISDAGLAPVHKRATANARRLRRSKQR
jgi:hypothetical protein